MKVWLMQLVNTTVSTSNILTSNQTNVNFEGNASKKFGDVFTKLLKMENSTSADENTETVDSDLLLNNVLSTNSLEEILELLNVSHDGSFIMFDNEVKSFDELMNLDDLLSIMGMNYEELQDILSGLMDVETLPANIWDLIGQINKNADHIISQLQSAFNGEHSITPKQAEQLLTFLKLVQLTGNKTDLAMDQPLQLAQLKELFETVVKEVVSLKSVENNPGQTVVKSFQQVVETAVTNSSQTAAEKFQQIAGTSEKQAMALNSAKTNLGQAAEKVVQTNNQQNETDNHQTGANSQQSVPTRTITIQLPVDKTSQAEQLVNRIERLLSQSQISRNQGIIRFQLKLYPENLGSIRIELVQKNGILSARLLTTTAVAKEMLDSQLHQLKNAFAQQNIQLDRIDVHQAIQDKDLRDQNLFNNFFNQQNQNNEENKQGQEESDEQEQETLSFRDYLMDVEV